MRPARMPTFSMILRIAVEMLLGDAAGCALLNWRRAGSSSTRFCICAGKHYRYPLAACFVGGLPQLEGVLRQKAPVPSVRISLAPPPSCPITLDPPRTDQCRPAHTGLSPQPSTSPPSHCVNSLPVSGHTRLTVTPVDALARPR
jgi:hypothetical protein